MAVYLDHNATTPLDERVLEAMLPFLRNAYGNPASAHSVGRAARDAVECARAQVAELVNAHADQVIFTSGGTEANNLALQGVAASRPSGRIALSAVEHASVCAPALALAKHGWQLDTVGVDAQGRVELAALRAALHADTRLVSVLMANNETGVLQDIAALSRVVRRTQALIHTDAVQALGKVPVDFAASGVHVMSLSAHKLYGPQGVGALLVDDTVELQPLLHGGGHERGRRAGTHNVAAIVGFGAAAALARAELAARQRHLQTLRAYLEAQLHTLPDAVILAAQAERLPNTVLVSFPRFTGVTLPAALDQAGIILSSGAACASGSLAPSHVLVAMGVPGELLRNVLRISLGKDSTRAHVDSCIGAISALLQRHPAWVARA